MSCHARPRARSVGYESPSSSIWPSRRATPLKRSSDLLYRGKDDCFRRGNADFFAGRVGKCNRMPPWRMAGRVPHTRPGDRMRMMGRKNGSDRLDAAMAQLIENQAVFVSAMEE